MIDPSVRSSASALRLDLALISVGSSTALVLNKTIRLYGERHASAVVIGLAKLCSGVWRRDQLPFMLWIKHAWLSPDWFQARYVDVLPMLIGLLFSACKNAFRICKIWCALFASSAISESTRGRE